MPAKGMYRGILVVVAALLVVVGTEMLLELRAYRRGWATLIIGAPPKSAAMGAADGATMDSDPRFGPVAGFPFRSPVVPQAKPERIKRIWIASSSLSEAANLPPDHIFAHLLALDLSAEGRPSQILNAGAAGLTLATSAEKLRRLGPIWSPDIIVVYHLLNDVNQLSGRYLAAADQGRTVELPAIGDAGPPQGAQGGSPLVRLLQSTTTYALLREHLTSWAVRQRLLYDALPMDARAQFRRDLEDLVAVSREIGAVPVLCTFASALDGRDREATPAKIWKPMFRNNIYLSMRGWFDTTVALNEDIRDCAARHGLKLIDLDAGLSADPDNFVDVAHFTPLAHERCARLIARELAPLLAGPSGAEP